MDAKPSSISACHSHQLSRQLVGSERTTTTSASASRPNANATAKASLLPRRRKTRKQATAAESPRLGHRDRERGADDPGHEHEPEVRRMLLPAVVDRRRAAEQADERGRKQPDGPSDDRLAVSPPGRPGGVCSGRGYRARMTSGAASYKRAMSGTMRPSSSTWAFHVLKLSSSSCSSCP